MKILSTISLLSLFAGSVLANTYACSDDGASDFCRGKHSWTCYTATDKPEGKTCYKDNGDRPRQSEWYWCHYSAIPKRRDTITGQYTYGKLAH
ncbi:hypothetical protein HYFRA_00002623 [Hymenoscyphus fraxineus]|uniref:Uncharacterized protein n=1 Tax=Hymenoscyphus fraxineus TaxID=746836 RepID=A0A9N9L9N9_9HELO|nr:hypothetical protein HYFRA_00002623 [Hymenoscyphus fraxineus]